MLLKFHSTLFLILFGLSSGITLPLAGQNFIGYSKTQIRTMVRDSLPEFYFAKEVINGDRSFLKFENTMEEQTVLFILNRKGVCIGVNRMYNFGEKDAVEKELSLKYRKVSKSEWRFKQQGKEYAAILKEDEWFLKLIIKPRKTNKSGNN